MNQEKTISELAKELGVSRQAIYKRVNQLPSTLTPKKVDKVYKLNADAVEFITKSVNQPDNQNDNENDNQVVKEVDRLTEQNKELKAEKEQLHKHLIAKDEQLAGMQKLLDQQQQLLLKEQQKNQLFLEEAKTESESENKGFFNRLFNRKS
ncbi:HTH domain-containing protein [Listeria valentina]|uniref:HTH domain-containing protein n=1 Tax=Listeria valentina TaxID=2705293 RepID=UPI001431E60E|nr:HTH domain-containing protein [Listeria valentina]